MEQLGWVQGHNGSGESSCLKWSLSTSIKSSRKCPERGKSWCSCLDCCPHHPGPDKLTEMMDGFSVTQFLNTMHILYIKLFSYRYFSSHSKCQNMNDVMYSFRDIYVWPNSVNALVSWRKSTIYIGSCWYQCRKLKVEQYQYICKKKEKANIEHLFFFSLINFFLTICSLSFIF